MSHPISHRAHISGRAGPRPTKKNTRRKGPSVSEWTRVRDTIERWYVEEERSQKEILELLGQQHGLIVELNMLKKRLKDWNFRRNFRKSEHELVATQGEQRSEQGLGPPVGLKIDGRLAHLDRVLRQCRKKPELANLWLQKGSEWHAQISRLCLKGPAGDSYAEMALLQVKHYWAAVITKPPGSDLLGGSSKVSKTLPDANALHIGFLVGTNLINKGQLRHGWRTITETFEEVKNVFKRQDPGLLVEILALLSAWVWNIHPLLLSGIAKYLLDVSLVCLGPEHPLSNILHTCVELIATESLEMSEVLDVIPERAMKVMVDIAEAEKDRVTLDSSYLQAVEVALINKIARRLGPITVRQMVQKKYSHYRATLGERNRHTLSVQMNLAQSYLAEAARIDGQEKPYEKLLAEQKSQEILSRIVAQGEKFPNDRYRIGAYHNAAEELARHYFAKQDFLKAHEYYARAVVWAAQKCGRHHSYVSLLLAQFRALRKLIRLGIITAPQGQEDLWQSQISHLRSGEAVKEVEWEPYHDEIDLDDNLELAEHATVYQETTEHQLAPANDIGDENRHELPPPRQPNLEERQDTYILGTDTRDHYMQEGESQVWDFNIPETDMCGMLVDNSAAPTMQGMGSVTPGQLIEDGVHFEDFNEYF